jgi:hypothetical protein
MDRPEDGSIYFRNCIQHSDVFNEFGVQMMVPHYEMQPEGKVVVSKSSGDAAPASDSSPRRERGCG